MEQTQKLIEVANEQALESRKILETLADQIRALVDVVQPLLIEQIQQIRSSRMTLVSELQQSLTALREVRKFFLEDDYRKEIDRLEEFVALCRKIVDLKESGVFDAVCDSAIRLAIREPERRKQE